jgi:hypothetical protein
MLIHTGRGRGEELNQREGKRAKTRKYKPNIHLMTQTQSL